MRPDATRQHNLSSGLMTLILIVVGFPLVLTGLVPLQIVGGAMLLLSLFMPALGKTLVPHAGQTDAVPGGNEDDWNGVDSGPGIHLSEAQLGEYTRLEHGLVRKALSEHWPLATLEARLDQTLGSYLEQQHVPKDEIEARITASLAYARSRYTKTAA